MSRCISTKTFSALYSSDLRRVVETATPTSQVLGLPIQQEEGLREIDVGRWAGLTFDEIAEGFPEEWASFHLESIDPCLKRGGGESYVLAQQRIVKTLDKIACQHPGEMVLIFSHGGVLRAYLAHVLGLPLTNLRRLAIHNTAICRVLLHGDGCGEVIKVNDTAHLESWATDSARVQSAAHESD
jgi:broad specificity phosphatase PhoE